MFSVKTINAGYYYVLYKDGIEEKIFSREKPWEIYEYVTGETFRDVVAKEFGLVLNQEVWKIIQKARRRYKDDFGKLPTLNSNPNGTSGKYFYVYPAVADPSQLATIRKEKYALWIKIKLREHIAKFEKVEDFFNATLAHKEEMIAFVIHAITFEERDPNNIPAIWLENNGMFIKSGKLVREIFSEEEDINLSVLAGYVQDEMYELSPCDTPVLVSDKPSEIYVKGGRFDSCMKRKDGYYFKIYDDVEQCKIAYMLGEDGRLVARALLWEDVLDNQTGEVLLKKLMDRIYYETNRELAAMKNWAKHNGYAYKNRQALNCYDCVTPTMEIVTINDSFIRTNVKFKEHMYDAVPYVDTFQWIEEGEYYMSTKYIGGNIVQLTNLNGNGGWLADGDIHKCCRCDVTITEGDMFTDDQTEEEFCPDCWHDTHFLCENCNTYSPNDEGVHEYFDEDERTLCNNCIQRLGYEWDDWSDSYRSDMMDGYISGEVTIRISLLRAHKERTDEGQPVWMECKECGKWWKTERCGGTHREDMTFTCPDCMPCDCCGSHEGVEYEGFIIKG